MLTRRQLRLQHAEGGDGGADAEGNARERGGQPAPGSAHPPASWEPRRESGQKTALAHANGVQTASPEQTRGLGPRCRRASASAFLASLSTTSPAASATPSSPPSVAHIRRGDRDSAVPAGRARAGTIDGAKGRRPPSPLTQHGASMAASAAVLPAVPLLSAGSYFHTLAGVHGTEQARAAPPLLSSSRRPLTSVAAQDDSGLAGGSNGERRRGREKAPAAASLASADGPLTAAFPHMRCHPATLAAIHHWEEESSMERPFRVDVQQRFSASGAAASTSRPRTRVSATQTKSAWRGCVRELCAGAGGGTGRGSFSSAARSSVSHAVVARDAALHLRRSAPHHARPCRAAAFVSQQMEQLQEVQRRLAGEVRAYWNLEAHRQRMRVLLDSHQDAGDAFARNGRGGSRGGQEGEEAYLKLLNPTRSEKEANILRVISAIDGQLNQQMMAIYKERDHEDEREEAHAGARRAASLPAVRGKDELCHDEASVTPNHSSRLTPSRRLELVDALVSAAVSSLSPFHTMLMPYQQEGVRWFMHLNFAERMNGILADMMGLGKTCQMVMYMACYKTLIEGLVERQLARVLDFTRGVVWRSWAACHTGGVPPGASPAAALSRALALVAEEEQRLLTDSGGVVISELIALWPQLCSMSPTALAGEDELLNESSEDMHAMMCHALRSQLGSYFAAIRTLKELKQWMWQLDTAHEVDSDGSDSGSEVSRRDAGGACQRGRGTRTAAQQQRRRLQPVLAMRQRRRVMPPQAALLPRKRGRPSKADIAARNAAAAAAGVAAPEQTSETCAPLLLDMKECVEELLEAATAVPGMSRVTNASLARFTPMRPILVIAPLSTLPHWRSEFGHFAVDPLFEVYVLNGTRAARDAETARFLHHARLRDANSSHTEEGGEENSRQRLGARRLLSRRRQNRFDARRGEHQSPQGLPEDNAGAPREAAETNERGEDEPEAAAPSAKVLRARTPVLVIPHDLLVRSGLSAAQRRIAHVHFHLVIIDEAQRIKNNQGGLFHRVCRLSSLSRAVLTGTPLQNNIVELFALLQFLAPQIFHGRKHQSLLTQLDAALAEASRSHALEDAELHILLCRRVHRLLSPFILRRDKAVLKAMLPPKKDFTLVCPLLPIQKAKLEEVEARYQARTLSGNPNILRRKILLHPYTTQPYFYVDSGMLRASGKLLVLDFIMSFLVRTRHKFLVFCGWTLVLDVVETLCQMRQLSYVRLDGRTSVEDREAHIASFNDASANGTAEDPPRQQPAPCCFLISKVAGGVGLNLQSADTVFLLDVDYNPQRDNQALSRVYRVGQRKEVRVLRLLIDHPSERGVVAIHMAKENLDKAVVQAGKYDLHASGKDREAALQELFAERSGHSGQFGGIGAEQDDTGVPWPTDTPTTETSQGGSSPLDPSSPVFPFGPFAGKDVEGAHREHRSCTLGSTMATAAALTEAGARNSTAADDVTQPPVVMAIGETPPPSASISRSFPLPHAAPAGKKAFRRVRFSLPAEDEEATAREPRSAQQMPPGGGAQEDGEEEQSDGGSHQGLSDTICRGQSAFAQRSALKRSRTGLSETDWAASHARGTWDGAEDGLPVDSSELPLASYLVAMRDRLMEALPRSPEERLVLASMLDERELEETAMPSGTRLRRRPLP